ncbi:MAG: hypothetical protein FWG02_08935 [Holophagaceae bacterium]|nr:hypothetical protein [Holophagaceae bacterium]
MQRFGWVANQHIWAVSFALATSMLLLVPVFAAQRPGRGIKPWWVACRYLAWTGLIGSVIALVSGEFLANNLGLLNGEWILRDQWSDIRFHQYFGGASVMLSCLCVRSAYIKRKEHQGIGPYMLFLGLLWAIASAGAGHYGIKLSRTHKTEGKVAFKTEPQVHTDGDENDDLQSVRNIRIAKILNYSSLVPMHPAEPVKSPAHSNRWIRVWVSPNASEAYKSGNSLPEDTLVVMSSLEDLWGRPTYEIGPLYTLEVLAGGVKRVGMYWYNVPESKQEAVGGAKRIYWTEPHPNLASCSECHADGMAPPRDRSRIRIRRPAPETSITGNVGGLGTEDSK